MISTWVNLIVDQGFLTKPVDFFLLCDAYEVVYKEHAFVDYYVVEHFGFARANTESNIDEYISMALHPNRNSFNEW